MSNSLIGFILTIAAAAPALGCPPLSTSASTTGRAPVSDGATLFLSTSGRWSLGWEFQFSASLHSSSH